MFSYRHAFHAGNHADVLKHAMLISIVKYMTEKPVPLTVIDTHAGAGLYRMDSELSAISAEALEGIQKIWAQPQLVKSKLLKEYLALLHDFNPSPKSKLYPGSPFIVQHLLNDFDKLKLFSKFVKLKNREFANSNFSQTLYTFCKVLFKNWCYIFIVCL